MSDDQDPQVAAMLADPAAYFAKVRREAREEAEVYDPLVALAAVSVDQAVKFQKSMTLIQTAGGETEAKAAAIATGIKKLAVSTGTSLDDLGQGIYTVATVYILHSRKCLDSGIDLRDCEFSLALDRGIDVRHWQEDLPLVVEVLRDQLRPIGYVGADPKETRE